MCARKRRHNQVVKPPIRWCRLGEGRKAERFSNAAEFFVSRDIGGYHESVDCDRVRDEWRRRRQGIRVGQWGRHKRTRLVQRVIVQLKAAPDVALLVVEGVSNSSRKRVT